MRASQAGDEVEVAVELDTAPREVEVPEALAAALAGRPGRQRVLRGHGLHPPQGVRPLGRRGQAGRDPAAARAAGARDDPGGPDPQLTARGRPPGSAGQPWSWRRMRARWSRSAGLSRSKTRSASVPRAARIAPRMPVPCPVSSTSVARRSRGIGPPFDQAPGFEGVDHLGGRAGRDVQAPRQVGQAQRPVVVQHAQRPELGRGDVPGGQGLLGGLAQLARDGPEGVRQRLVPAGLAVSGARPGLSVVVAPGSRE